MYRSWHCRWEEHSEVEGTRSHVAEDQKCLLLSFNLKKAQNISQQKGESCCARLEKQRRPKRSRRAECTQAWLIRCTVAGKQVLSALPWAVGQPNACCWPLLCPAHGGWAWSPGEPGCCTVHGCLLRPCWTALCPSR